MSHAVRQAIGPLAVEPEAISATDADVGGPLKYSLVDLPDGKVTGGDLVGAEVIGSELVGGVVTGGQLHIVNCI